MKRICFLIGNLNNSGGTERVTSIIANELSKQNHDVSILSMTDGTDPFFALAPAIETYSLHPKKLSFKKHFFPTIWKIRQFVKQHRIDSLIVVDSISCVFTVPALYGLKVNHICWEHFNFNVDLKVSFRRLGRKLAAKYCDTIVTLTNRDKHLWQQGLTHIEAKIVPIANPAPYENTHHTPSLDSKTVLSVGRLTNQKGFDLLIAAWAQVCQHNKDWTLCIVGSGEDEKSLKTQACSLGIFERIDFVPATKEVVQYYQHSAFYCLSSRFEGLPMVLLEAQAFGLPIVAFDCDTGPSDIITNKVNGYLCENNNPAALASALTTMIDSTPADFQHMCTKSLENSERFAVEGIIKKWIAIL